MSFEKMQLAPPILKALNRCGHTHPTPIQSEAIPKVLTGCDLIASAQTGTGKTAAFVLPSLQHLTASSRGPKRGPRVLILTPTRELASQITQTARAYSRYLKFNTIAIFGGMPFGDQIRALAQNPEIIVATPGRLIDHIWRGRIDVSTVELFVLDEADRMLDMGFIDDVEFIADAMPENSQTLLFAATMGDGTTRLAHKFMKEPERVEIAPGKITHDRIEQRLHLVDNVQHKNRLLHHLCEDSTMTRAIIFSATKRDADVLARELVSQGHTAAAFHADMSQNARNRTMANMRHGKIRLLVATDVAARGIDITGITHVINFDLPQNAEDYVNRIGRTGRAGESGIAISFASRRDLPYLDRIERYLGRNLPAQIIQGLEPENPVARSKGDKRGGQKARRNSAVALGEKSRAAGRPFKRKEDADNAGNSGRSRPRKTSRNSGSVVVQYKGGKNGRASRPGGQSESKAII